LSKEKRTTYIGWNGISARIPTDWTLTAVGGDRRSGYLRIDYEQVPRLQVKWSRKHIDLEAKRDEYLKRLAKGRRRRPSGIEVSTDARAISKRSKPKKDIVSFAWHGPHCGLGVLWNCHVCGRAVMAQAAWSIRNEGREEAQEVLESLDDHGVSGWDTWGVDGLVFLAPAEYEMEGWQRMTRYLELRLVGGPGKLKVARWGLVPLVLGERSVKEWYEEENSRRRDIRWEAEETRIKGHDGVAARGKLRRLAGDFRTRLRKSIGRPPAVEYGARGWHCTESNRLYLVEAFHKGSAEALDGAVKSVLCHEGV